MSILYGIIGADINWQTLVAIISVLTAMISAFVGPFIAYRIAVRSARANAQAAHEKEWIHEFRNELADFLTKGQLLSAYFVGHPSTKDPFSEMNALHLLQNKLELRLDPSNPDHNELVSLFVIARYNIPELSAEKVDEIKSNVETFAKILALGQRVISEELKKLRGSK